jgi:hypothetical protein
VEEASAQQPSPQECTSATAVLEGRNLRRRKKKKRRDVRSLSRRSNTKMMKTPSDFYTLIINF